LLDPVSPTQFREQSYGRQHLLIRGRPEKFGALFAWEDLNRLLNASRFPHEQILITGKNAEQSSPRPSSIIQGFRTGASMVVNRIHELDPKIGELVRALEAETGEPMNVNLYLSPPARAAFPRHFDRHDVFVLQLYGHKVWEVCEPTLDTPIFEMAEDSKTPPSEASLQ